MAEAGEEGGERDVCVRGLVYLNIPPPPSDANASAWKIGLCMHVSVIRAAVVFGSKRGGYIYFWVGVGSMRRFQRCDGKTRGISLLPPFLARVWVSRICELNVCVCDTSDIFPQDSFRLIKVGSERGKWLCVCTVWSKGREIPFGSSRDDDAFLLFGPTIAFRSLPSKKY